MTQDDIIRAARKAGIAKHGLGWTCWEGQLERFAALVAAAEREDVAGQALTALEYYRSGEDYQPTPASESIAALRRSLQNTQSSGESHEDSLKSRDEDLMGRALHALKYRGMSPWKVIQPVVKDLEERLK